MVSSPGVTDRPRFRQDLVAEPIDDGGKRFIDVADPDTGNMFRFFEVEYSLACAMDGERDVAGIVRWAQEELGLTPSPNEVQNVIATLGDLGYLDHGAAAATAAKPGTSKWDQPTAMGDSEDYLAHGVVAAKPAATSPKRDLDVELGNAGATHAATPELPKSVDVELGAPGAHAKNRATELPRSEDIPLGVSGRVTEPEIETDLPRRDVSVDLSEHLAIGAEDVKEAVRQSQVMRPVDVPKELLDSVEPVVEAKAPKAEAKAPQKPETKPEKPAEAKRETKPAEAKREAKPAEAKAPAKAPVEQPKRPVVPGPERAVSPVLLVVLAVVLVGVGFFFVYKYVIQRTDKTVESSTQPVPVTPPKQAEPPPPPPVETVKLATEQAEAQDVKPVTAGQLEMIAANDAEVKAGEVVARLAGHKPIETEIGGLEKDIDKRVGPELAQAEKDRDAAQATGNKAGVTAAETRMADRKKSLDDKQGKLAAKRTELDKYLVKAPVDGKLAVVAKALSRVTPNDVLAKLTPSAVLVGTFKTANGVPGARVLLAVKGGTQKLSCKVTQADPNGVKVACPHDAAADGSEVSFAGPDTSVPPAPAGSGAEIEMGEEGSGSAAKAPPEPPAPPPPHPPVHHTPPPRPPTPPAAGSGSGAAPEPPPPAAGSAAPPAP